jgi:TRAP-type C4-dicarboxylate transport system permease small subunit
MIGSELVGQVKLFADGAGTAILNGASAACGTNGACDTKLQVSTLLTRLADILTYLVGAISIIMIIYGGLRYVISRGDASQIKAAKDTIVYAVAGVVVAIVAFAIIKFVTTTIGK